MLRLSYGILPERLSIIAACEDEPYRIRGVSEAMAEAINQGIDSHLEAVFFAEKIGARWNQSGVDIEPDSMPTFLRRLTEMWEDGNEEAGDDASCILETLGFEWI